jgi:hypothetical protein
MHRVPHAFLGRGENLFGIDHTSWRLVASNILSDLILTPYSGYLRRVGSHLRRTHSIP